MHASSERVLLAQARLVQDSAEVSAVVFMCSGIWRASESPLLAPSVNRLTASLIYVACGCRLRRCRTVVNEARTALRGHRRDTERDANRYEQRLLENALVLSKRTTPKRPRKAQPRHTR